jgi:hypothetical protein
MSTLLPTSTVITPNYNFKYASITFVPIPVAARPKVWACGRPLAVIGGLNPPGRMDVCLS